MQLGVSALNANADELRVGKMLQDGFLSALVDWNGSFWEMPVINMMRMRRCW